MAAELITGQSEEARPGPARVPNPDAHGPQGAALVLELQRLRRSLDDQFRKHQAGSSGSRPPSGATARSSESKVSKRKKRSRLGRVIDFCLVQFGLKSPAGLEQDEIPIAPQSMGQGLVSRRPLPKDLAKPVPAAGPAVWTPGRVLRIFATSLVAGTSFLLGRNRAIDAADASLLTRAGRSYENELRTGLRVLLVVTLLGGGWLVLAPLAGAVVVPGNLVVQSNIKSIQHPTGGVVAELKVADGARVAAGDLLLRLDATQVQANLQIVSKQLDEVRARLARLTAERDGLPQLEFPAALMTRAGDDNVRGLLTSETSLFKARSEGRASQKDLLQSKIAQLSQENAGLEAQVSSKVKQLDLIAGELTGVQELYDKRLVPLARLTTLQREAARIEGERGQLISSIAETRAKVGETQLQIARLDQDFRTDVVKELGENQGKEAELIERGVSARDQLDRIEMRAPTSGTVHQLSVHTIGGVIRPGDVVMQLVPDADDLLVEAKLQPHDIDQVRPGQQAFVRFSAFNQRTTPQLTGTVSLVSADIARDPQTNASYYSVRVVLSDEERRRLGGLQLVPGMPAEVFMQTGSRTMMSYLIKPITEQFNRAFVER
ncbi:HlyD family type I secretion periplasmic adaptor subunit [Bradyrhizobium liaoningense]|uniref:HlyD family type I secretion periplasmic adaptor subunit n=1 Tax=Bradyrhizobium liaoningense TaxID=43992 RepID=UPI001BACDC17|nr:HlyD family type I secretion periplasmic adaptor subunit [Bradyrhizobium liaoningense]MBR0857216.1 HlyD family type I secretion periplasmic adaptor subunit [Bradyrhizobium liaoningense]